MVWKVFEPRYEKTYLMTYAHPCSLISALVVRCLKSITPIVAIPEISRLYLASVAEQTRLGISRSHTAVDRLSHDVAHLASDGKEPDSDIVIQNR